MLRIVGNAKDLQYAHDCKINNNITEKFNALSEETSNSFIATLIRGTRTNKRWFNILQVEEVIKLENFNENIIIDINDLCEHLKKRLKWDIVFASSSIRLRKILHTDNNFHSATQEISIHKDANAKFFKLNLLCPHEIMIDEIEDSQWNQIKKVAC